MSFKIALTSVALLAAAAVPFVDDEIEWVDWGENPMENPDFMAEWGRVSTPGDVHAELAKSVGSWTAAGSMWMAPGAPAMPMTADVEIEMILGGRYLKQSWDSSFMGEPFQGLMIMGYDILNEQYTAIWMDSMGTSMSVSHGHETEDGAVALQGTMRDLMTPGGRPYRSVSKVNDDGTFSFEMYDSLPDGGEFKVMEATYTRKGD